ncbi:uncharacterized protein RB166_014646 [Leptodactylus fuscus]
MKQQLASLTLSRSNKTRSKGVPSSKQDRAEEGLRNLEDRDPPTQYSNLYTHLAGTRGIVDCSLVEAQMCTWQEEDDYVQGSYCGKPPCTVSYKPGANPTTQGAEMQPGLSIAA